MVITSTFQLGPGLGPARELALWRAGIARWESYAASGLRLPAAVDTAGQPGKERRADADRRGKRGNQQACVRHRYAKPFGKLRQHAGHDERAGADDEIAKAEGDEACSRPRICKHGVL